MISLLNNFKKYCIQYKLHWLDIDNIKVIDRQNNTILMDSYDDDVVIYINDNMFYTLVFDQGELGFGRAFVKGYWETNNLSKLMILLCENMYAFETELNSIYLPRQILMYFNKSIADDKNYIRQHYDIGNDFYEMILDKTFMNYSVGFYEKSTDTVEDATIHKMDSFIDKLGMNDKDDILEIGCGWGLMSKYMATKSKCKSYTGLTISSAQYEYCSQNSKTNNLDFVECDYRDYIKPETYSKIISIEMMEHVGKDNYLLYLQNMSKNLKQGGKILIQCTISTFEKHNHGSYGQTQFILNEIYPGGQIPKISWIMSAINDVPELQLNSLELIDGKQYATLFKFWSDNLTDNKDKILETYSMNVYKSFEYFFNSCIGLFDTNALATCVILLEKI